MKELACKICNKQYKTIQSLCNHNKRFHNSIKTTFSELKQPLSDFIQPLSDFIQPLSDFIQQLDETTTPFVDLIQPLHICVSISLKGISWQKCISLNLRTVTHLNLIIVFAKRYLSYFD